AAPCPSPCLCPCLLFFLAFYGKESGTGKGTGSGTDKKEDASLRSRQGPARRTCFTPPSIPRHPAESRAVPHPRCGPALARSAAPLVAAFHFRGSARSGRLR